ncbi:Lipoyltransferase and lipoate-protein ligase [Laetiporus sulphureus 93-53]|uniref:Putative lipoate-protein ligase A n=1 Tax=Laetiporus sulphureus 93-53 TaxID=1314785 RepID=A0A165DSI6_9APHY|nr:Lipoyltransferase and lipoate-protein ligase [Laetiporus sulphureus 93-53]KZT05542.1 Lipoyltransferase and lipoate-protein ligase [Laetiporus sulphureus 93-53]
MSSVRSRQIRSFATALSPSHSIYISNSTNPYFNLTLEDWLFRHKPPRDPLLLIYRDRPCIVIGRNQNPWKEVNMRASKETGVPFIRRRSGGGAVYHDLGNTNFSIHLPRTFFDRHATAQVVLRAVRSLGVDANVNDRNDICVGKDKISRVQHVSGSAYKIVNNRAYHHGTMLISTRLDMLGDLLHSNKDTMETKGVASVRSPVRNLQQFNPSVNHEKFVDATVSAFREEYGINEQICTVDENEENLNIEYIRHGMAELPACIHASWDWAYGQTPEFTHEITLPFEWSTLTAKIHSRHGIILSCTLTTSDAVDDALKQKLITLSARLEQQRYGFVDEASLGSDILEDSEIRVVWHWLKGEMDS